MSEGGRERRRGGERKGGRGGEEKGGRGGAVGRGNRERGSKEGEGKEKAMRWSGGEGKGKRGGERGFKSPASIASRSWPASGRRFRSCKFQVRRRGRRGAAD